MSTDRCALVDKLLAVQELCVNSGGELAARILALISDGAQA